MTEIIEKKNIIFISDVHFGAKPDEDPKILEDVAKLLGYAKKEGFRLIILGDLFDYWMEFGDSYPKYAEPMLNLFEDFNKIDPTLYITGNHDNWGDGELKKRGFDVEHEYRIIETEQSKFLLMHGDGLKDSSFGYPRPFYHRILRNPTFVSFFKAIFGKRIGLNLMKWFSAKSRNENEPAKDNVAENPLDSWVISFLNSNPSKIDGIIAGHTHQSKLYKTDNGLYINTGRFFRDRTVLVYTNSCFQLVTWDGKKQEFTPSKKKIALSARN